MIYILIQAIHAHIQYKFCVGDSKEATLNNKSK